MPTPTASEPAEPRRSPSRWAGVPIEARRRDRRALLIAAAFDLLGQAGTAGTTVRAVCSRARLNPRYFYESFGDLDELVVAVYDDVLTQLRASIAAAVVAAPDGPVGRVRATVEATVRFVDDDRRRGRVLYVEALGSEALNRRRIEAGREQVDAVQLGSLVRAGAPPEAEEIGRIGAAMLVGGFTEILVSWLDGRIKVSRDELVDDTTEMFLAIWQTAGRIVAARSRT